MINNNYNISGLILEYNVGNNYNNTIIENYYYIPTRTH